jgi:methionyl-tRNA formyltransferase
MIVKVVFLGTPDFAVPSLKMLVQEGYNVIGVFTQPDRPKGRGKKLFSPPVKDFAMKYGLSVYQYDRIKAKEGVEKLRELSPDLMITVAFGQILSKEILDIPPLGCINVHASLLPKYRGAAPIQWAIINGEQRTGITTMYTDIGLDTGDMILSKEIEIGKDETAGELHDRLAILGADVLRETLVRVKDGTAIPIPQDHEQASYYPVLDKAIGKIDWRKKGQEIHDLVRGVDPWPGAFTRLKGDILKIWKVKPISFASTEEYPPGKIIHADEKVGLIVMAGDGPIKIEELQAPGGKRMSSNDFLRGNRIQEGLILGE